MKKTIDTGTGKVFYYNEIVEYMGYNVPSRQMKRKAMWLHPSRVEPKLLAKLNPGVVPVLPNQPEDKCDICGKVAHLAPANEGRSYDMICADCAATGRDAMRLAKRARKQEDER